MMLGGNATLGQNLPGHRAYVRAGLPDVKRRTDVAGHWRDLRHGRRGADRLREGARDRVPAGAQTAGAVAMRPVR